MTKQILTQEQLKKHLHYNPKTGIFTWIMTKHKVLIGSKAGYKDIHGYNVLMLNGRNYRCARLAFLYMTGHFPIFADHIDMNKSNDKWENLREATHSQNMCNSSIRKNNKTGFKGVYKVNNRYSASCRVDNKSHHIGYYETPELAAEARNAYAKELHGEFYRE